jgi:hypothetical protein
VAPKDSRRGINGMAILVYYDQGFCTPDTNHAALAPTLVLCGQQTPVLPGIALGETLEPLVVPPFTCLGLPG